MKKLISYSIAVLMSTAAIISCRQRDVVAPTVVQQSNTQNGVRNYNFSILVIPAASQGAKTEGLSGVSVTISQGQNIQTATTGTDGIANFTGLNEGEVSWSVSAPSVAGANYANASGIKSMTVNNGSTGWTEANQSNQTGGVSVIVPLAPKTSNLSGKIVADFDFLSSTQVTGVADVEVRLTYKFGTGYVLEPNFYVVKTDANGNYSFANVPALDLIASDYNVTAEISVEKASANGSNTVIFKLNPQSLSSNQLAAGKSVNLGVSQLQATGLYTSSVTGFLYGDFAFITANSSGNTVSDVAPDLVGPAVTNVQYNKLVTASGFALATYPGFNGSNFLKKDLIVKLTYSGLSSSEIKEYVAKTSDNGSFSFANVPATGGGVTATLTCSVQVSKVNQTNGITELKTFALGNGSGLGVTVSAEQVKDFGAQQLDLLP